MHLFQTKSIRGQMISAIVIVTIPLIVITTILLSVYTIITFRKNQQSHALSSANIVTGQTVAAILFDDNKRGNEILSNFQNEESVEAAYILRTDGTVFAQYERHSTQQILPVNSPLPYAQFKEGKLFVARDIRDKDEKVLGTLHLIMNTNQLNTTIRYFLFIMATILIIILLLTFLFADRSQRAISQPILTLAAFAKSIGEEATEDKHIEVFGKHEIGILYKRFNDMLDRLNERDKEIRSASDLLQDILNSSPAIILVIDRDGVITLHNKKVWDYVDEKEIVGSELWGIMPALIALKGIINSVILSGQDRELRGVSFHLKEIESADITIFHLNETKNGGVVVLINDVTDINEKEQQLIQIQKMETVGTLAGGLAHDFNNVMGGIVGTLSLMEVQMERGITEEDLRSNIEILSNASARATEMVNQLLSLSHKSEVTFEQVDLVSSIENIVKILNNSIDKSVEITTDIANDSAIVLADANQLEQIFLNIAVNAAHSMTIMKSEGQENGGPLLIRVDEWHLKNDEQQGIPAGAYQHVSIADKGVGIPKSIIAKMFDPFFTTKAKGSGTGLGLSMVYNLVKRYDGHLIVDSVVNEGTTFHVLFPKSEEPQGLEDNREKVVSTMQHKRGTILIIDDEDSIRIVARSILELNGYTVFDFASGKEAISFFDVYQNVIDLVLLDLVMPEGAAEEVYPKIKKISEGTKVLLSSGFKRDERVQQLLDSGVDGFIHKPFTYQELSQMVDALLYPDA